MRTTLEIHFNQWLECEEKRASHIVITAMRERSRRNLQPLIDWNVLINAALSANMGSFLIVMQGMAREIQRDINWVRQMDVHLCVADSLHCINHMGLLGRGHAPEETTIAIVITSAMIRSTLDFRGFITEIVGGFGRHNETLIDIVRESV